ncbi:MULTISPECIES: hypothetical protein [Mycetohabitans]|uniref:hypothetical protein n=1 Tax=Mycetohabitans TaxID=2571159 RepID=UPI001F1D5B36|nr:hypothetical protein [Mycetohabitans sp. B3]MCF2135140.1 hypothetical protein [Mycetohabitans sp. B3]
MATYREVLNTPSQAEAAPVSQADFFTPIGFALPSLRWSLAYGRVARSYTRPARGNLRAAL